MKNKIQSIKYFAILAFVCAVVSTNPTKAQSDEDWEYFSNELLSQEYWIADDNSGYKMILTYKGRSLNEPVKCMWWSPDKKEWYEGEVVSYDVIDSWFEIKSPVSGKTYKYIPNTKQGMAEGYIGGEGNWGLEERSPDGSSRFYYVLE